jgi:redox-sensitive bicupin YhaK (pirin superfamily)
MGASIEAPAGSKTTLSLRPDFEYGAIVTHGEAHFVTPALNVTPAEAGVQSLTPGTLIYFGEDNTELSIAVGSADTNIVLVGGRPLHEPVLMWWNFVARTKSEITKACGDWNNAAPYLGEVKGDVGTRLSAPMPPWVADGPEEVVQYP